VYRVLYTQQKANVAEVQTLLPMVERVLERFDIRRVVLVADRGLLPMDNLQDLLKITLPDDRKLEFILAVPARRYAKFAPIVETMQVERASGDWVAESTWSLDQSEDPDEATAAERGPAALLLFTLPADSATICAAIGIDEPSLSHPCSAASCLSSPTLRRPNTRS
jgi:hypothetical protein